MKRASPGHILADILGVQPMTGPTASIFALRTQYGIWDDLPGCRCDEMMNFTFDYIIDFPMDHRVINDSALRNEMLMWPVTNCRSSYNFARAEIADSLPQEESRPVWVWRWSFESADEAFAFKLRWV